MYEALGKPHTATLLKRLDLRINNYMERRRLTALPDKPAPPVPTPAERREPVDPGIAVFAAMANWGSKSRK